MTALRRLTLRFPGALEVSVVIILLCLAAANVVVRATWQDAEDGVLWATRGEGVVAVEVAPDSGAAQAGLRPGDVLLAINRHPTETHQEVHRLLQGGRRGSEFTYTILRLDTQQLHQVTLQHVPAGNRSLYFVLVVVAVFTLLVGASVRLRRPTDQATTHFFWMAVAFFGVFAFSFSGRFDRLDWFFYWADQVALVLLAPLFLHFALAFPERPQPWMRTPSGRLGIPLLYVPGLVLLAARVLALRAPVEGARLSSFLVVLDRIELAYLGIYLMAGLTVMVHALRCMRSVTARRQLRWIVWGTALGALPFTVGYGLPYAAGLNPAGYLELLAIPLALLPLAFASALVRYRLMDVEVIIKRGLVYAAAVAVIVASYAVLLRLAEVVILGGSDRHNSVIAVLATLVVVLLARPVRDLIQNTLDRAYYRDRYDYRRALVGFARDLNSDLDLHRLSERLVSRVMETLLVERMALLLGPLPGSAGADFTSIADAGFEAELPVPPLAPESEIASRLLGGHTVALDDSLTLRRVAAVEVSFWLETGIHYFVSCVSKEGTIAVMALGRRMSGEPLSSEDMALLAAVAGQVATAIENARLYRELQLKAGEVERMREFSDNIIESLHDGIVVIDPEGRIVRWNRALEDLYGVSWQAATGRRLEELFDAAFVEAIQKAREDSAGTAVLYRVPLASRHEAPRQRSLLVNVAAAPLRTASGATAGLVVILEDITSRVQLEEQLQISDKMASIGLLAAGVAHEVNTPLTGISSFTQMLLQGADPDDPRTRLLEKIERQTFRAAKIVNGLLNLARPARVDAGAVDLHAVINDVLSLLEHQFRTSRIQLRRDFAPAPPVVGGIEHKLQQVFLNLFLNARDAMPKGGWLSISTWCAGDHGVVEIADTGLGIPAEYLSRIYDPFFTTKEIGRGTGLGLSITYGILQEHGGSISCNSVVGQGTRFTLSLPLAVTNEGRAEVAN